MVIADTLASKEAPNEEDQKDKSSREVEQSKEGEITGSQEEKTDSSPLTIREGSNYYRDKKLSKEAIEQYLKMTKEKKCLVKLSKTYYPPREFVKPWREVLFAIMRYITLDANQTAHPQPSISEFEEEGSDSGFSLGEESQSDSMSELEESLEDFEAKIGKKRKQVSTKPSSSKGKKNTKEKVFQIRSSSSEVSEDSEKDEPQSPRKKKTKNSIQIRNKQKRQDDYDMELEDKVQRKDLDVDQKLEEEITGEGFDQRVSGNINKISSGNIPKNEQDNPGEKTPPSNPPTKGLKGFVNTIDWLINSCKKVVEDNKKLSHKVQILETISIGEGKSMAEYAEDLSKTIARAEEIIDSSNPSIVEQSYSILKASADNTKILIKKLENEKDSLELEPDIEAQTLCGSRPTGATPTATWRCGTAMGRNPQWWPRPPLWVPTHSGSRCRFKPLRPSSWVSWA
ncbi:uncharacterized protein LOC131875961 [Cryptomeria japonica]|uniref:uncharacterized protein LOC131875961 n=1 Tax=Cryptomeria japonica TaxID=3369 RepID=UPI0027DAB2DA|nr:uncharacterized protein LOC131875961 [Cryptomeria japonica]